MDHAQARQFPENLSKPAQRALKEAGYTELKQLSNVSDSELLQLHGFGPKGLLLVKEALEQAGMSTAAKPQGAPSAAGSRGAKSGRGPHKAPNRAADEEPGSA